MTEPDYTWVEQTITLDAIDPAKAAIEANPGWRFLHAGTGSGGQTTLTYGWPWPWLAAPEEQGSAGPVDAFSIGSDTWPGLSKMVEEMGEALEVIGKIMGVRGKNEHWDGTNLRSRLADELADVDAAITFVRSMNDLPYREMSARSEKKLVLFHTWHTDQRGRP